MAEEEEILIALPTVQTPSPTDASRHLVAIAVLTRTRASEILRQMESVAELASKWLGVFKLCSFDSGTFYVPAGCVEPAPARAEFTVLDPSYTTPEMAKLVRLQIGIVPGAVVWEACDEQGRFFVSTIELSAEVLRAVAVGGILSPGTAQNAQRFALPAEPMFDQSSGLEEFVM